MAEQIMDNPEARTAERLAAAEFIRRCTGIDRAPAPARKKPASFGVVRAPAAELAPPTPAATAPPAPRKRKRKKGPPGQDGLVVARVAAAGGESAAVETLPGAEP